MGLKESNRMHEINDIKINTILNQSTMISQGSFSFTISAHQNYYSYSFVELEFEPELVGVGIEEERIR